MSLSKDARSLRKRGRKYHLIQSKYLRFPLHFGGLYELIDCICLLIRVCSEKLFPEILIILHTTNSPGKINKGCFAHVPVM